MARYRVRKRKWGSADIEAQALKQLSDEESQEKHDAPLVAMAANSRMELCPPVLNITGFAIAPERRGVVRGLTQVAVSFVTDCEPDAGAVEQALAQGLRKWRATH